MEMRRLMWFMALAFSLALLVQYIELPYGYVLSSLLSFGKSQVTSAGSFSSRGSSSNHTGNLANQIGFSGVNSMKTNDARESLNLTKFSGERNENGKDYVKCETNKHRNDSFGFGNDPEVGYPGKDFSGIKPDSTDERVARNKSMTPEKANSSYTSTNNSSLDNLQMRNATPTSAKKDYKISQIKSPLVASLPHNLQAQVLSPDYIGTNQTARIQSPRPSSTSMGKDAESMLLNSEKSGLKQSGLSSSNNTSIIKTPVRKRRFKGPPAKVVPISAMNDLLRQSHVSYQSMKPQWPSKVDKELLNAKALIESAQIVEKNSNIDVNVYRNFSAFIRSYELMEQTLKIYIYTEGERPIFHQPELNGIYASEGWFMKQLEQNRHFVTKNAHKAHLFYLPFSSRVLQEVLYVPNSHSRRNLVQYLSSYLQTITTTYPFWNRTDGADHFLVACHDWAPAETSRIMKNCIRSLCNANVGGGFKFGKDISLPEIYVRDALNPLKDLGGKPPSQRRILAFFAGHMHGYLRPVLLNYWENKDPDMKIFGMLQNTKLKGQMTYIQYMKSSKYCISAKGYEPYTPRVMEAIYYECVPVIISDNYIPPFFETLNWESFAVFVLEKDIPNLKNILMSIPEQEYLKMQQRVRQVQKHFLWNHTPVKYDVFHMILHSIWYTRVFQMTPG
ncbi:Acetylglucosaminyltransferase EXT1/exostosin 1 [Handroanthus impetiginosus]|uniref:Acetylglucosaminyltransferase EXT1/exostosin 1 n=1 Tax=Handroanthus impetiginosus TaxID=429701 RepID=A0A2G9I0B2_9LAMI|nr:Acetylglucosaminyltransferase EXT1/exostosin 1 [Handroanthus impetiginosus]